MTSKYDEETDTWDEDVGICPYCNQTLIENPGLKYTSYSQVQKHNGQIIWICHQCIREMETRREVQHGKIGDWSYIYEFVRK